MDLVPVRTYNNALDARLGKMRLELQGIDSFLFDEHTVTVNPLYGVAVGVRLMVREADLEGAHAVLMEE